MSQFIGRGEGRVESVLRLFYPDAHVFPQVPIWQVINKEDFETLGPEHNKHKFDFVLKTNQIYGTTRPDLVIEVNYKHGEGPAKKWNNVYLPAILKANKIPLVIEDFACNSLFDKKGDRPLKWEDFEDVISAFKTARIPY